MPVNLKIRRFDPALPDGAYTAQYTVPVPADGQWTVLDLLDYVQQHVDPSLRYHRHSVCNRGICMACLIRINGRVERMCAHVVDAGAQVLLEPANPGRTIVDLVSR